MVKPAGSRRNRRPEDDEMRFHVLPLYAGAGFDCYVNSTRVKPTGVTPGIADVEVFAVAYGFRFVHEVKIGNTRQSQEQKLYQERCDACGVAYVLGDVTAAQEFVAWLGFARWIKRGEPKTTILHAHTALVPIEDRVFLWNVNRPDSPMTSPSWWHNLSGWSSTPLAIGQRQKWGWKPTPGAVRNLVR